jgi:ADP-heptose:LPS heptosyltransferase
MNNRILIRANNWIGDTVMMMPAVAALRTANPDAFIALYCPPKLRDLWLHNPQLNQILTDPDKLRDGNFDTAYIFPNSFRAAYEIWHAKIPRRIGYRGHWRRTLLTEVVPDYPGENSRHEPVTIANKRFLRKKFDTARHQVYRHLALVGASGTLTEHEPPLWERFSTATGASGTLTEHLRPRIFLGPDADTMFRQCSGNADPRPILALNPGAEFGPAKRWPAERFTEVARRVHDQTGCRVVLLGGPRDAAIPLPDGSLNLVGKTTLLEVCAVLKASRVLLTNDTGPMHLAAALDVPQVCLFGSTSPELTGPLSDKAVVLREPVECSPCFLRECPVDFRCMNRLTVERVAEIVAAKLFRGDARDDSPPSAANTIRGYKI